MRELKMSSLAACFAVAAQAFTQCIANAADVMPVWQNDTVANTISFQDTFGHQVNIGSYNSSTGAWSPTLLTGTSGGILYFSSPTTSASSGVLGANQIVLGGGAGAAPSTPVGLGTSTQVLHGNASGAPTFGAIASADIASVLASPPCIGCTAANTGNFTTGTFTNVAIPSPSAGPASLQFGTVGSPIGDVPALVSFQLFSLTYASGYVGNTFDITSDNAAVSNAGAFGLGWSFVHNFGGTNMQGGRQAVTSTAILTAASSSSNTNHNYVALVGNAVANTADGGTNTGAGAKGAMFGANPVGQLGASATNMLEVTAGEADVSMASGSSAKLKFGWSIASLSSDAAHGAVEDAGLAIGAAPSAAGFNTGIKFTSQNGAYPVVTAGTLMDGGSGTVGNALYFNGNTISGVLLQGPSGNFVVTGTGIVHFAGHEYGTGSAPTLTFCGGGSPVMSTGANDTHGTITEGTSSTGCVMTFHTSYTNTPDCVLHGANASETASGLAWTAAPATLSLSNATLSGFKIAYTCMGN